MPVQGQVARHVGRESIAYVGGRAGCNQLGEAAIPGDLHGVIGWDRERVGWHIPTEHGAQVLNRAVGTQVDRRRQGRPESAHGRPGAALGIAVAGLHSPGIPGVGGERIQRSETGIGGWQGYGLIDQRA